ncbi:hypothetical protein C475_12260 [Halosimplex carlsbadense 2-9-1]|uniref:Rpa-associated protein n=1 Tax=Halosimplex carlsbadense 2-9-1 TaxID=797114 RepID=M0CQ58_9EURY|nr:hypothetical protein [Halosimplex carlsbadense]ELZ24512.1 hypothetical protein C475_12260 [Halosimplex carlsbadense 2-9-1]
MSGSEDQGGAGRREVAYRLFAAEFDDADFSYSESDEERAPNYVVSPTGGRVNRLFVVGVLTEVENASEDVLRARIVDPTGAFVVYAGQYQPEAQAFFDQAQPPMFVAVTGKARTFQPDDSDVTYTSIRPENVNEVDAETRDRWTVGTARQTLDRVRTMAGALQRQERGDELRAALEAEGVDTGLAAGIPLAIDHYGTTAAYLDAVRSTAVQALEVVAGEREEVDAHSASPDAPGDTDPATLAALDVAASVGGETTDLGEIDESETASDEATASDTATATADTDTSDTAADGAATADANTESAAASEPGSEPTTGSSEPESTESSEPEPAASSEPEPAEPATAESATESDAEPSEPASTEPAGAETEPVAAAGEGGTGTGAPDAGADSPDAGADAASGDDLDDFDPGEFELDDEEREEIEAEYGTGFTSGNEVDDPGEAGIETPDPEDLAEAEAEAGADEPDAVETETESATAEASESEPVGSDSETETGTESEADDAEPAEDVDLEDAVMDAMAEHDGGDGAHADEIVEAVTGRTGAGDEEVREAIQDALMGGRCYEPEDDVYKPI